MNGKNAYEIVLNLRRIVAFGAALSLATLVGCAKSPQQQVQESAVSAQPAPVPANAKVYKLHGKVLSIDQANKSIMIDGDEVPGFMGAMAMPYPVKANDEIAKVAPGDEITADIIVPRGDDPAYIQNIVVVKKATATPAPTATNDHEPQPGESVPDFALLDENGKTIHLSSYRGEALLVTFIYTRCPFPDFCPLVSRNFAKIYAQTKANPDLNKHMRLLSVSFDPDHDTPAVLRKYSQTFNATTGGSPYGRWTFAVIPKDELGKVTDFFGVTVADNAGSLVHSMSTSVITPDGKIYSWREDTDWKPEDLIADATAALNPTAAQATPANLRGAGHEIAAPTTN
jgi:protein SCO1